MPFVRRLPPVEYAVARYISYHKRRWHKRGSLLTAGQQRLFQCYFPSSDLQRALVAETPKLPLPSAPGMSLMAVPDPSFVVAVTFDHVIVTREPLPEEYLFHELIHVVQYRLLGINEFARQYVRGFLATGAYATIPLEACAYELEDRFRHSETPFDVEAEVRRRLNC